MTDEPDEAQVWVGEYAMAHAEAQRKLTDALTTVRKWFDQGADDCQHTLLETVREYWMEIEIEPKLIDPVQILTHEVDDRIIKGRRKREGKAGTPLSVGQSSRMVFAAVAVTALHKLGAYKRVGEALRA